VHCCGQQHAAENTLQAFVFKQFLALFVGWVKRSVTHRSARTHQNEKQILATDEHRSKTNSSDEVNLCLSVFICVHLWQKGFWL
jgi:hypothetical protein